LTKTPAGDVELLIATQKDYKQLKAIQGVPLPAQMAVRLAHLAEASLEEQRVLEAADTLPFETYRQRYLCADSLVAGQARKLDRPAS
jgi:glutamate--cysteine ligase